MRTRLRTPRVRGPFELSRVPAEMIFFLVHVSSLLRVASCWTSEQLRFYDNLRLLDPDYVDATTQNGSSVVQVTLPAFHSKPQGRSRTYRLCHLTSMLPLSINGTEEYGRDELDWGLRPEGALLLAMLHWNYKVGTIVPALQSDPQIRDCNVRFTMEFRDTQSSQLAANTILIEDVLARDHSLAEPDPIALLGASRSAVAAALSITSSNNLLPLISATTLSSLLDNKGIYGLYGRTNPGSAGDARAAARYLHEVLNVTHCGVLFVRDEYGNAASSDFRRAAEMYGINVAQVAYDPGDGKTNAASIERAMEQLKDSGLNYFYAIIMTSWDAILREGQRFGVIGEGKHWFYSYHMGTLEGYKCEDKNLSRAIHGMTSLSFDFFNDAFEEEWKTLEQDAALKEYFHSKQPDHLNLSSFTFSPKPSPWDYLTYDSVMSIGFAACEAAEDFFSGPALFRSFAATTFEGASGLVDMDDRTASRHPLNVSYSVTNVVANEPNETDCTISFSINEVARKMNGSWITTGPTNYSDASNVAPAILPTKAEDRVIKIGAGAFAFGFAIAGLAIASSLVWGAWTVMNRKTHVVQLSQPEFLLMLCLGTILMASSIIPSGLQNPPASQSGLNIACMVGPWLYQIGFTLTFSALFSKTAKVNKMFRRGRRLKRIKMETKEFMLPFVVLFSLTIVILISWTIVSPLTWQQEVFSTSIDRYGRPVTDSFELCMPRDEALEWVFVILLFTVDMCCLAFAAYENYRARHIHTDYNESNFISASIICILQAFAIGFPALLASYPNSTSRFVIYAIVVSIICCAVLFPLFVPKEVARRKEAAAERKSSMSKLSREWETWQDLKSKNDELKKERESLKSSKTGLSVRTVDESFIYYEPHNSFWQEIKLSKIDSSSRDDESSSRGDDESSEGCSQNGQTWSGAGLDQLCL